MSWTAAPTDRSSSADTAHIGLRQKNFRRCRGTTCRNRERIHIRLNDIRTFMRQALPTEIWKRDELKF